MQIRKRQFGVTLTELLVVVAVMTILMSIGMPTVRKLMESFESSTGTRQLINAALANARAIAVREQTYAGVRFQQAADEKYYMMLVMHEFDANLGIADRFRVVEGRKPMALPEDVSVLPSITGPATVVFSPAGKLTTRDVRCLRNSANDTIFNSTGNSMFSEDGTDSPSKQTLRIWIGDTYSNEQISPYTGELVIEYK